MDYDTFYNKISRQMVLSPKCFPKFPLHTILRFVG